MSSYRTVELDNNGEPMVSWPIRLASVLMLPVLVLTCYAVPLYLGFNYSHVLQNSPLVKYSAYVFGFVTSLISWIVAFLFGGIVLGKFQFAKDVLYLFKCQDFNIAMAMVFLTLPITGLISRVLHRTINSNMVRCVLTCLLLVPMLSSSVHSLEYIIKIPDGLKYLFSCSCIGFIFFIVFLVRWSRNPVEPSNGERVIKVQPEEYQQAFYE